MRKSDYWMKQLDERILEHLDVEAWSSPSVMARESEFSASEGHIRDRCRRLQYVGFIAPIACDMWEITTDGRLYLEGKIDARYRPYPTVERVLRG
jgi:hypothetical protein